MPDDNRAFTLDRASPIPLYVQIKQALSRAITGWMPERKFYTEDELRDLFGVSRMTVRQAIQELVAEGSLRILRGIGTFVVRDEAAMLASASDLALGEAGGDVDARGAVEILSFERRGCPDSVAGALGLAPDAPVRAIARLHRSGGVPVALDQIYLPLAAAEGLTIAEARGEIAQAIGERGATGDVEFRLEATVASPQEARSLRVAPGTPLLRRRLRLLDEAGGPIAAGHTLYRADLVRYAIRMPVAHHELVLGGATDSIDRVVYFRRELGGAAAAISAA
jgi:GntR family transcriptional regulator